MVFDAIYDTFAKIVDSKMKDKNVDDEIFGDMVLKEMAKALTVAIYRNGTIEDVHAGEGFGAKDFKGIPDSCMKEINKDVCNKCYTMLKLLLSDEEMDCKDILGDHFSYHRNAFLFPLQSWYDPCLTSFL